MAIGAYSWQEACLERPRAKPGVTRTRCDTCAYGMAVNEEGFNLHPTGI